MSFFPSSHDREVAKNSRKEGIKLSRSPFKILKLSTLNQTERKHRLHDSSGCSDKISLSKEIFGDYKSRPWHEQISSSEVNNNQ